MRDDAQSISIPISPHRREAAGACPAAFFVQPTLDFDETGAEGIGVGAEHHDIVAGDDPVTSVTGNVRGSGPASGEMETVTM
jgi:hypothetical protein